jgi:hypothetical protein
MGYRIGTEWVQNGCRMGAEWVENGWRMGGEWVQNECRKYSCMHLPYRKITVSAHNNLDMQQIEKSQSTDIEPIKIIPPSAQPHHPKPLPTLGMYFQGTAIARLGRLSCA